jgi:hypothetical protein
MKNGNHSFKSRIEEDLYCRARRYERTDGQSIWWQADLTNVVKVEEFRNYNDMLIFFRFPIGTYTKAYYIDLLNLEVIKP